MNPAKRTADHARRGECPIGPGRRSRPRTVDRVASGAALRPILGASGRGAAGGSEGWGRRESDDSSRIQPDPVQRHRGNLFRAWYGPNGATIPVAKMDVRVGGNRLVCIEVSTPPGAMRMWFTGEYREVVKNKRLVYTESLSNESGEVMSPSNAGTPDRHPITTVVTVELDDVAGRTTMLLSHAGIPAESPGAVGWTMALDKLTALVRAQHPQRRPSLRLCSG